MVSRSKASRCCPWASGVGPTTVPVISTGCVTPRSVSSPSIETSSPLRSIAFDDEAELGVLLGVEEVGRLQVAGEVLVVDLDARDLGAALERPSTSLASNSLKVPRNVPAPL